MSIPGILFYFRLLPASITPKRISAMSRTDCAELFVLTCCAVLLLLLFNDLTIRGGRDEVLAGIIWSAIFFVLHWAYQCVSRAAAR